MGLKNTASTYGSVAKILHWLIFVLVVGMLIIGFNLEGISDKATRILFINYHKLTGLLILELMLLRALWALVNVKPRLPFDMPGWQKLLANGVHVLLYLLVIAMPIAGWIMSCAGGRPPRLGSMPLALPIPQNKEIGDFFFAMHQWLAYAIIAVIAVHVLAALYHYFVRKDDILQRML